MSDKNEPTCRGDLRLGTACGRCSRCAANLLPTSDPRPPVNQLKPGKSISINRIKALEAENARLREALEFYRDEWEQDAENIPLSHGEQDCRLGPVEPTAALLADEGGRARKTLGAKHD